jgi:hypothetical protein
MPALGLGNMERFLIPIDKMAHTPKSIEKENRIMEAIEYSFQGVLYPRKISNEN